MLPYPGIPYGEAPSWCYSLFEYSFYLLFIYCFATAVQKGYRDIWYLLGGLLFGLLLEYMEVVMGSYTYGRFVVMLGKAPSDIPFCIGIGWGIIMYSARLFTDRFGLSIWTAAALDTLLALNIDLSMDVVAYRTHMWHWYWSATQNPLTMQWFGIPYGNFVGWQTVVFCYAGFSRLFERYLFPKKTSFAKYVCIAVLGLLCSIAVLYLTELLWPVLQKDFGIRSVHRFTGICAFLIILVVLGWRNKKKITEKIPAVAWWVPGWCHLLFISYFFVLGFYTENKWMTLAAILNLFAGVVLHLIPLMLKNRTSLP